MYVAVKRYNIIFIDAILKCSPLKFFFFFFDGPTARGGP
jgi:hypothetical protein